MRPVILFVDDEPNILRGLKRLLRNERERWEMVFVEGGPAAIEWLSANNVDAIVTDMRMPQRDGADVLEFAAKHGKGRVRLVLSGEADRELTYRTVGYSHQFLSKPCDDVRLIRAIETPLAMASELDAADSAAISASFSRPACCDATHCALTAALETDERDALTAVVAADPCLALRVFQLANSAYFGRPANTLSVADATAAVGGEVLKDLHHRGLLIAKPSDMRADGMLSAVAQRAAAASRELAAIAITEYGVSELEAEAAYAAALISWTGEAVSWCGVAEHVEVGALSPIGAASYGASLLGLPMQISAAIQALAKADFAVDDPLPRARALASALFEKAAA